MICAHPPCNCIVSDEGEFCSAECRAAGASPSEEERDLACGCGHPDCYREADSELADAVEAE